MIISNFWHQSLYLCSFLVSWTDLFFVVIETRARAQAELESILRNVSLSQSQFDHFAMGLVYGLILVLSSWNLCWLFVNSKVRGDKCLVIDPKLSGSLSLLVQSSELKVFRALVITRFYLILRIIIVTSCLDGEVRRFWYKIFRKFCLLNYGGIYLPELQRVCRNILTVPLFLCPQQICELLNNFGLVVVN